MKSIFALGALIAAAHGAKVMRYHNTPIIEQPNTFIDFKMNKNAPGANSFMTTNTKAKFQQYFKGVPVYDGFAVAPVHGVLNGTAITGNIVEGIEADVPSVFPKIPMSQTFGVVRKIHGGPKITYGRHATTLYIWVRPSNNKAYLVYMTDTLIYDENVPTPRREIMFVDANTADVYKKFDGLTTGPSVATALDITLATGPGGNEKTGKYTYGVDYESLQCTSSNGICYMETDDVLTCNLNHKYSSRCQAAYSFTCPAAPEDKTNGAFSPEDDAHAYGTVVFDLYNDWFGSRPITQQLELRVHYGNSYENAFWDGQAMTFGDGGSTFYPLVSLDVVAHEVSHGVTEQNSGLEYTAESGGMNEAFSDMAGEAAKYYLRNTNDFLVGQEIFKGNGALRYFETPSKDGRSIDTANDYYDGLDVHYSSGVYNRAFYNIATASGYDTRKAFEAFYRANVLYWTKSSTFDAGACGVLSAAADLGYATAPVDAAFNLVGVKTSQCGTLAKPVELNQIFPPRA